MTGGETSLFDEGTLDMVASNLDLRAPNKRAVRTIALRIGEYEDSGSHGMFEGVIDAAVGMGKDVHHGGDDGLLRHGSRGSELRHRYAGKHDSPEDQGQLHQQPPKEPLPGLAMRPAIITARTSTPRR